MRIRHQFVYCIDIDVSLRSPESNGDVRIRINMAFANRVAETSGIHTSLGSLSISRRIA